MAKEKILVVDDEEDILELIRFNLVREGYKLVISSKINSEFDGVPITDFLPIHKISTSYRYPKFLGDWVKVSFTIPDIFRVTRAIGL